MSAGKRALDIMGSAITLIVGLPLMAIIAALIKAEDGGDVFFSQDRVGQRGRLFRIWKFRTMSAGSSDSPQITAVSDKRITRTGAWLRRHKLDELPQLYNVLIGDMSLVGPRPEVPKYVALYSPEERKVLDMRPGLTDRASLLFLNESELLAVAPDAERLYIERIMPAKLRINLAYAKEASLMQDIKILAETVRRLGGVIFSSRGIGRHSDRGVNER